MPFGVNGGWVSHREYHGTYLRYERAHGHNKRVTKTPQMTLVMAVCLMASGLFKRGALHPKL